MIEEIQPDLYRIVIPLPNNPLGSVNSYVIKGRGRSLIVDTGMNRDECLRPMLAGLDRLNVELNEADFFITHLHADHLGLVGKLATETSKILFNETEASYLSLENEEVSKGLEKFSAFLCLNGFPKGVLRKIMGKHPGARYSPKQKMDFFTLKEGKTIAVGDYIFKCIETAGHSPGHMCLYDLDKKILISGDHILFDITPNVTWWPMMENALKEYLINLEKVYPLDVDLVLPGHRSLQTNHRGRIRELQEHHRNRLREVLDALEEGSKTAWEVAPHITWDIDYSSWEELPSVQKWFAAGETIAHLHYLEEEGEIRKVRGKDKIVFHWFDI